MSRLYSTACERNRDPILEVLRTVLPARGTVLEIASGTGMHAAWFAPRLPDHLWQPSDHTDEALRSIEAWRAETAAANLLAPVRLSVTGASWPLDSADAIFNANMIHISPLECTHGLLDGAARLLGEGAPLILYGPFKVGGEHTADSNRRFDESLRSRDPSWGVRDLDQVAELARQRGFGPPTVTPMPANNQIVVFLRS